MNLDATAAMFVIICMMAIAIMFDLGLLWAARSYGFHWIPKLRRLGNTYSLFWLWWFIQPQF